VKRHLALTVIGTTVALAPLIGATQKEEEAMTKNFDLPVDQVYAAAVQVASKDYNLKSAIKEAYTVNFFTGGSFSLVATAICHDQGNSGTMVSLSLTKSEANRQLFFVGREKQKLAKRFWAQLESAVNKNEKAEAKPNTREASPSTSGAGESLADMTVKSTPDGADIIVDGKFSGSAPSTLHVSAGEHTVKVTSKGFRVWERTITLTSGGTVTLNATLDAEPVQSQ